MIYVDVNVMDGTAEIEVTPLVSIKPTIVIYDINRNQYYFFEFTKEISEPTTVKFNFFEKGYYVAFVGFLYNETFYITDLDSFQITQPIVPSKAQQPYETTPSILVPFLLAGSVYLGEHLINHKVL